MGIGYLTDYHFGLSRISGRTIRIRRFAEFACRNQLVRSFSLTLVSWDGGEQWIGAAHRLPLPR